MLYYSKSGKYFRFRYFFLLFRFTTILSLLEQKSMDLVSYWIDIDSFQLIILNFDSIVRYLLLKISYWMVFDSFWWWEHWKFFNEYERLFGMIALDVQSFFLVFACVVSLRYWIFKFKFFWVANIFLDYKRYTVISFG